MKKVFYTIAIATLLASCGQKTENHEETTTVAEETEATIAGNYGDTDWDASQAISMEALLDSLQNTDSIYTTVSGTIDAACQAKGCWMSMTAGEQDMTVKFKDYGFFVPKNSANHDATMRGWAYAETVSIAEQVEHAKDAEATAEEIAQITEPKLNMTFMADGVVIK